MAPLTFTTAIQVTAAIVGLLIVIAGAWALIRTHVATVTINLQSAHAEALEARLHDVELEARRCHEQSAAQAKRIEVLEDTVSGTAAIAALSKRMDARFDQLIKALKEKAP